MRQRTWVRVNDPTKIVVGYVRKWHPNGDADVCVKNEFPTVPGGRRYLWKTRKVSAGNYTKIEGTIK